MACTVLEEDGCTIVVRDIVDGEVYHVSRSSLTPLPIPVGVVNFLDQGDSGPIMEGYEGSGVVLLEKAAVFRYWGGWDMTVH